jgi:hypothetical protein
MEVTIDPILLYSCTPVLLYSCTPVLLYSRSFVGRFPRHFVPGYDRLSLRDALADISQQLLGKACAKNVPEGRCDRSLARSAWKSATPREPSRRVRCDSRSCGRSSECRVSSCPPVLLSSCPPVLLSSCPPESFPADTPIRRPPGAFLPSPVRRYVGPPARFCRRRYANTPTRGTPTPFSCRRCALTTLFFSLRFADQTDTGRRRSDPPIPAASRPIGPLLFL